MALKIVQGEIISLLSASFKPELLIFRELFVWQISQSKALMRLSQMTIMCILEMH